jgi:hypothetical protein
MSKRKRLIEVSDSRIKGGRPKKVVYRRATVDGRAVRLRVIDADGSDFTVQLTDAFRSSVRKARAENREIGEGA